MPHAATIMMPPPPKVPRERVDLSRRQKRLALLHEELRTLALFDRVHHCAIDHDPVDNRAFASRQIRRSQIMAEIGKLNPCKPERSKHAWISSVLLLCEILWTSTVF